MRRFRARRNFAASQPQQAAKPLEALTDEELAAMAREKGFGGVPERWKRETLLARLQEA